MNLYEYSQLNNTEMGIIITKDGDLKLFEQINETAKKIIRNSKEVGFEIKKVEKPKQANEKNIKKESTVKQSVEKPVCYNCYKKFYK
jgi:hypothetical protein